MTTSGGSASLASVTLIHDKTHYAPGETIQATIVNGMPSSIFVADHGTSCTLVNLQRAVEGGWQNEGRCAMMKATRFVEVAPGALGQTLAPGRGQMKPAMTWPAGTYRLTLTGARSKDLAAGQTETIASTTFTIG